MKKRKEKLRPTPKIMNKEQIIQLAKKNSGHWIYQEDDGSWHFTFSSNHIPNFAKNVESI